MYALLSGAAPSGGVDAAAPQGPAGKAARLSADWRSLSAAIRRGAPTEAALALAEPAPGRSASEIAWRTPLAGPALPLSGLFGGGRAAAEAAARGRAGELAALGSGLAASADPASKAVARLLSRASAQLAAAAGGAEGGGTLFLVGGVPVLAGWDLERHAAPKPAAGAGPPPASARPESPPSVPAPPAPGLPAGAAWLRPGVPFPSPLPAPQTPPPSRAETPPSRTERGGRALRAVASASAAFLLTLLAFQFLGPGFGRPDTGPFPEPPEDFAAGDPSGAGASLRAELASLKARYKETLVDCPLEDAAPAIEEAPPTLPEPGREAAPPPASAQAPRPLEADPRAAARAPAVGDRLTIPDNPKDLAFLEGCWSTVKAPRTHRNGWSNSPRTCFDKRGNTAPPPSISRGRGGGTGQWATPAAGPPPRPYGGGKWLSASRACGAASRCPSTAAPCDASQCRPARRDAKRGRFQGQRWSEFLCIT
jgi:hypothetical protein